MDNYPPGMNPNEIENPFADQREIIEGQTKIRYNLTVEVGDDVVYETSASNSEGIEESLRKAEKAVDAEIDKLTEASMERDED